MWAFEEIFGVPVEHSLRLVTSGPEVRAGNGPRRWEHEEYDGDGRLVAVYESWPREEASLSFVKYSPQGWVRAVQRCRMRRRLRR